VALEPNADAATGAPKAEVVAPWAGIPKTDPGLFVPWTGGTKAGVPWAGAPNGEVVLDVRLDVCPNKDPPPVLLAAASPNAEGCWPAKAENPPPPEPEPSEFSAPVEDVPNAVAGLMNDD
jgi:hypothetical protein